MNTIWDDSGMIFFDFEENECDDMGRYPTISKNHDEKYAKID